MTLRFRHEECEPHKLITEESDLDLYTKEFKLWEQYRTTSEETENYKDFLGSIEVPLNFTNHHVLKNFDWKNVVLAGGIFTESKEKLFEKRKLSDLDFFIVGLSPKEARLRLNILFKHIMKVSIGMNTKIVRTKFAITFFWDHQTRPVQIVLSHARDPLELLLSFDLSVCRIYYDGVGTYGTMSAIRSFETKRFIVSKETIPLSRKALHMRIEKYKNRGFECDIFGVEVEPTPYISGYQSTDLDMKGPDLEHCMSVRLLDQYRKNPFSISFIMKKEPKVDHFKDYDITFYNAETIWYMINNPEMYIDFLNVSRHYKDLPKPLLEGPILLTEVGEFVRMINEN